MTLPQFALIPALGILCAWAVVQICRWQQRSLVTKPKKDECPQADNCKSIDELAQHLIEVAKEAAGEGQVDLIEYAARVVRTELGQDLVRARRKFLNRRFRMSDLLHDSERTRLDDGTWLAHCPRCYPNEKHGTLLIDEQACVFRCEVCHTEGECFELILLTAPNLRKFVKIRDLSYRVALLMYRFGLVVRTAEQLIRQRGKEEGGSGRLAPLQPQGPWRPRGAGPSALEVAMRAHQDVPCLRPRKLDLQSC